MDLEALRNKPTRYVVGLMSGTSCDGIDAALVRIEGTGGELRATFLHLASFPYPDALRDRLLGGNLTALDVCLLNFELGERLADAVVEVQVHARKEGIEVDFVASHGHTVAHVPPRTNESFGTLQIGEAAIIAERTGLTVVSDFRPRDMASGGQGAPLVPYADWVLFAQVGCDLSHQARCDKSHPTQQKGETLVCLNIGGIANFTVVTPKLEDVIAFDTGPGNMAIDGAVRLLTHGAEVMDKDGIAAAKGTIIEEFLEFLLSHPYFKRKPPKSTGVEEFGADVYLRDAFVNRRHYSFEDLIATITNAVAQSIVRAFDDFVKPHDVAHVIISGGGARNKTLVDLIAQGLPDVKVCTSEHYGIPINAKEAVAFAILGNEIICGTPANVPRATGATHAVVLGKITPGG